MESDDASVATLVEDMCVDALAGLPPAKVEEILRPWLAKAGPLDPNDPSAASFLLEALALASCLALFTPTLMGAAPIERYAKQRRADANAETRAALDILVRTEFRLLQYKSRAGARRLLAEDLASGASLALLDDTAPESAMLVDVAAWLAPLPSGDYVAVGPLLPLDAAALAEARSFIRSGKGLVNPRRCAAAVYRHVVRHGGLRVEGLNFFSDASAQADALSEEWDALDALAAAFLAAVGETTPALVQEARELASVDIIVHALSRSVISHRDGRANVADVFSTLAYLMLETLDRRDVAGFGGGRMLEEAAADVERAVSHEGAPASVRALFEELRRRLLAARRPKATDSEADAELARVLQRIQALRAKTVEQGCTEQEALASARKVAELLDRYGLTLGEIEMRERPCEGVGVDTGRKRRAPIDECAPTVAHFCDCKMWFEKSPSGSLRFVFFGLPADVAAAHLLYDLIVLAFEVETAAHRKREPGASARSFQIGLAHGIRHKLHTMKTERDAANQASGARELVPIKRSVIEEEMEKLWLSFHAKPQGRRRKVTLDDYEAGVAAGRQFKPHRAVEGK
jgi:hypothetical protein